MTAAAQFSYELIQPSARRRRWELQQSGKVQAVLEVPAFRPGARATFGDRRWSIQRRGAIRAQHVVLDASSREQLACVRPGRRRRRLEAGELVAEWRRLPGAAGFGFVTAGGERLVSARLRAGLMRSRGKIVVSERVREHDAVVLALLAAYLLIRRGEEQTASETPP
jgi:hypothetical protein